MYSEGICELYEQIFGEANIRRRALLRLIELMRQEPYSKHVSNMRYMNAVYRRIVNDLRDAA